MDVIIHTRQDLANDYKELPIGKIRLQHLTGNVYTAAIWADKVTLVNEECVLLVKRRGKFNNGF